MMDADHSHSDRSSGPSWPVLLVFACLALGFAGSAVQYERITATAQRDRAQDLAAVDSVVEGRLDDIGKFLSNPQTRMIRLWASADGSAAGGAVVAWNEPEQRGYLLCDQLPALDPGQTYQVWAIGAAGDSPARLASIEAKAGSSVYAFQARAALSGKTRVEITAGARSPDKSPIFAGEID